MADSLAKIIKAGTGKQGYCKLCSMSEPEIQDELDRRIGKAKGEDKNGNILYSYTPKAINEWLATKIIDFKPVNRQTIYSHRDHVMHPKDRAVVAIKKRRLMHGHQPQVTSGQAFLDAVIAMGHQNAMDDPEAITVDQALKATQIKQASKNKGDAHQTLVAIFTGSYQDPGSILEGESKEL